MCFSHQPPAVCDWCVSAISLQQCNGVGQVTLRRGDPHNVTCEMRDTTRNVSWAFLSLIDGTTEVLVDNCVLISPNREASNCQSLLPYFRVQRPHYAYTSLEVVWDLVPAEKTYGRILCSLDGGPPDSCYLILRLDPGERPAVTSSGGAPMHEPRQSWMFLFVFASFVLLLSF